MNITDHHVVGEVVAADYRAAAVFEKFGIDFCCKGNRSIADVCENEKIDSAALIQDLEQALKESDKQATDFNAWPLDLLADYIEKKHHRYVDAKLLEIKPYLAKIVSVHGGRHPELAEIEKLFSQTAGEMTAHMKKEEFILFPFIRKMTKAEQDRTPISRPHFSSVENPIEMMKHDHNEEGERFAKIVALSNNYTPPADACNTYRVTFALLGEFEADLHMHIHLENNILFPKAIEMEKRVVSAPAIS